MRQFVQKNKTGIYDNIYVKFIMAKAFCKYLLLWIGNVNDNVE